MRFRYALLISTVGEHSHKSLSHAALLQHVSDAILNTIAIFTKGGINAYRVSTPRLGARKRRTRCMQVGSRCQLPLRRIANAALQKLSASVRCIAQNRALLSADPPQKHAKTQISSKVSRYNNAV